MTSRSEKGVFLGYSRGSTEYWYASSHGVHSSRSLQRLPVETRWDLEAIRRVAGRLWKLREPADPDARLGELAADKLADGVDLADRT